MAASSSSRAQPMTSPTPRASTGASTNESPPNPASIDNYTPSTNPPPTNHPTSVSVTYPNGDPTKNGTPRSTLLLVDYKLWDKFHQQKNEMIITNDGRCLFPCLRFTAIDLDPNAYYGIRVDFEKLTPESLRFDVNDGEWRPHETLGDSTGDHQDSQDCNGSSRNDLNTLQESYMHPDGFKLGIHWMSNKISFAKVKLTNEDYDEDESSSTNKKKKRSAKPKPASVNANNKKRSAKHESSSTNTNGNHNEPSRDDGSATNYTNTRIFHMKSFHKYIPRIHLMQWDENSRAIISSTEFRYETTEFTAVTHYQNYNVTQLKILHNPHAKGKVRKVLPPVEIPSDSHSTSTTSRSLVKKRSHSELRSSQGDSDGMIEDGDLGSDGPEESEMAVDTSSAGTSNGGIKKRPRLSSTSKGKAPSVGNGRIHMAQGGYNNMCRIDEDNDALVVISLGRGPTADAKVSERTSRHHFSQQGSSNGESIAIAGFRSRSTTNKVSWTGQRTQTTASTRAIERTSRSGGDMYGSNQQRKHQHPQQQPLMISNYQSRNTSQLTMPGQLSPPSQQRNIDRARTNRMDPLPSHLSDFDLPSILGSPSITPIPNFDVDASASASASSGTGDDGDADLLQFNQPTPLISLVSLDDDTMPDQTALQVSPSNLEGSALAVNETTDTLMMDPNPPPPALSWSQQSLLEQNPTNIPQDLTPAATTTASSVVAEDATGTDLPWTMQLAGQNSTGYFPETSLTSVSSSSRPRGYGLSLSPNFSQPFSQSTSSMLLTPGSYVDNDGTGMVPGFSTFGTLTPSLNNGSNTRSGPSPIPSGRSRSDSGMSANYGYGNSGGSNLHQGPRMTRMTILDSRTFMSTSPAMSHMPEANNNLQANIDSILRENMRLKTFIRERYGKCHSFV
ncbi:hypothetical protein BGX29_001331 [Mortierella sp. GBA35]|nr:hypothetical protein BGX29_001331 [Mortierella sp. GBA35]